jgi:hypothetical protein
MNVSSNGNQLDSTIVAALHVLDTGDARSVQVLTGRRPTYDQLLHARALCNDRGYALTVVGEGGIVVRRLPDAGKPGGVFTAQAGARRERPAWCNHLIEMREGVL